MANPEEKRFDSKVDAWLVVVVAISVAISPVSGMRSALAGAWIPLLGFCPGYVTAV